MIKINLLPTKRKKKAKPIPTFIVVTVILLVLSVTGSLYANSFMKNKIDALKEQKKDNAKKMDELKLKMEEVTKFENLNNTFQSRKKIIDDLTKNQSLPVRILDEVSITLSEGVWITGMSISRGMIQISGVGFSNSEIVAYIQGLKESKLFSGVKLHGTSRSSEDGVETYTFTVSFTVQV
jgi:type IV pilus assembly protein PilN